MCLFIRVAQSEVDVNVEPGKSAILLHNLVWFDCNCYVYDIIIAALNRMKFWTK